MCRDDTVCACDERRWRQLGGDPGIAAIDGATLGARPPGFRATLAAAKGLGMRRARCRACRRGRDLVCGRRSRLVREWRALCHVGANEQRGWRP